MLGSGPFQKVLLSRKVERRLRTTGSLDRLETKLLMILENGRGDECEKRTDREVWSSQYCTKMSDKM